MSDTSVFTIVNEAFMVFSPTDTDTLIELLCVFVCPVLLSLINGELPECVSP